MRSSSNCSRTCPQTWPLGCGIHRSTVDKTELGTLTHAFMPPCRSWDDQAWDDQASADRASPHPVSKSRLSKFRASNYRALNFRASADLVFHSQPSASLRLRNHLACPAPHIARMRGVVPPLPYQ